MRRKSRIDDPTEYYSLVRALRAVDEADVALLVIDATEGVTAQDQRLAERIDAAGCPVVVLLNKWDLLDGSRRSRRRARRRWPASCTSSATRRCSRCRRSPARACTSCCPVLADAIERYHRRVPTRDGQRGPRRRAAGPAGSRRRPGAVRPAGRQPTRPRSRCSSTGSCRRPTCATWSASSGSTSTWARCRSSSGCASARAEASGGRMPWCEHCAKFWTPSSMKADGSCPTCGRILPVAGAAGRRASSRPRT